MTTKDIQEELAKANLIVQEAALKAMAIIEPLAKLTHPCPICEQLCSNVSVGFSSNYKIHYFRFLCDLCGSFSITAIEELHTVSKYEHEYEY